MLPQFEHHEHVPSRALAPWVERAVGYRLSGFPAVYVVVDDPVAVWARARQLAAEVVRPMEDTDYGSRGFSIADSEGNRWSFGTYAGE